MSTQGSEHRHSLSSKEVDLWVPSHLSSAASIKEFSFKYNKVSRLLLTAQGKQRTQFGGEKYPVARLLSADSLLFSCTGQLAFARSYGNFDFAVTSRSAHPDWSWRVKTRLNNSGAGEDLPRDGDAGALEEEQVAGGSTEMWNFKNTYIVCIGHFLYMEMFFFLH